MCRLIFFIFLYSIFFSSCSDSKSAAPVEEKLPEVVNNDSVNKILKEIHAFDKAKSLAALFKKKSKGGKFNGCVLIAQQGQIIYQYAYGYSNIKKKDTLKLNSAFQLASTSKTLTAAAILLLKDEGKLKLTDTLQRYFPGFPYGNITIHDLLTHRSGLGNYLYFGEPLCDERNCYKGMILNNATLLTMMMNERPSTYFAPARKFAYCNTNYALLALIIEQVSGMTYSDFLEQRIFKPLGMKNTWVHEAQKDAMYKNKTVGHTGFGKVEEEEYADEVLGDKGIYSTVGDLLLWDQALYTEKILKKETIEAAFTGYSNEHKGKRNYGYGWRLVDNGKNNKTIYHNGWWHGYNSLFFRRPSDRTTVIILSNRDNRSIYHIEDILEILDPHSASGGDTGVE
jgi:CubicO group peptidase (beta-lactamase class C family)